MLVAPGAWGATRALASRQQALQVRGRPRPSRDGWPPDPTRCERIRTAFSWRWWTGCGRLDVSVVRVFNVSYVCVHMIIHISLLLVLCPASPADPRMSSATYCALRSPTVHPWVRDICARSSTVQAPSKAPQRFERCRVCAPPLALQAAAKKTQEWPLRCVKSWHLSHSSSDRHEGGDDHPQAEHAPSGQPPLLAPKPRVPPPPTLRPSEHTKYVEGIDKDT